MAIVNDSFELTVLIPAYEEAESLSSLLPLILIELSKLKATYEVIVVDTNLARDNTKQVCDLNGVTYLSRKNGEFYGDAIRTGVLNTKGVYTVIMDADGSHNPNCISRLWEQRMVCDLVIASRYIKGGCTDNPVVLIFMSRIVNILFRFTLNLNCLDVSNSYRLYKSTDLKVLNLKCNNFDIVEEILVSLVNLRKPYRIVEIPITFEQRKAGKSKRKLVVFAFSYIYVLLRLLNINKKLKK